MGALKVTLGKFRHGLALRRRAPAVGTASGWAGREGDPVGSVALKGRRGSVRWRSVLAAGALVGAATILLGRFVIFLYVFSPLLFFGLDTVGEARAEAFGFFVGRYAMPAFFFLATVAAALWVGRRIGPGARLHGVLVGLTAFVASQVVAFTYAPGLILWEMAVYPALAVAGGLLGGGRGWSVRAGEEALHEASRDVAAARSARAIAAAVGERLAGTDVVGVSVWEAERGGDTEVPQRFVLAGDWGASGGSEVPGPRAWPPGSHLDDAHAPALSGLFEAGVRAFDVAGLSPEGKEVWERRGTKAVLLVPLAGPGGAWAGLLVVESRRGFPPSARRAYATVGAQAAPALESMHLVEEARRAGLLGERKRLAGEIHDTLAQDFTSIVTNLEAAEAAFGSREPLEAVRGLEHLDRARSIAREGLTEARRLVRALKPRLLEDTALPEALSRLARGWSEASGVAATCTTTGPVRPLPPEVESALFRAAQEALTNVAKHAGASRAAITLSYVGDQVVLDVLDDGRGFDPSAAANAGVAGAANAVGGYGLAGMRERAEALGGTLTVESAPGEGTTLAVELPGASREKAGAPA